MNEFEQDPYSNEYQSEPRGSNPLGVVGFILSILCVTSPIGLLISFIAVFKAPRGFAIAGTIIGALFSAVLVALLWGGSVVWPYFQEAIELATDMEDLKSSIQTHQDQNDGVLPASFDALGWDNTDPWGNAYIFEVDPEQGTWTVTSKGPDGTAGNEDDFSIDSSMDETDVSTEMSQWMSMRFEEQFQPSP